MEIKSSPDSYKRPAIRIRLGLTLLAGFLAGSLQAQQQCAVFKSEIGDVRKFEQTVNQLTDSLKVYAEVAAFAARYTEGRSNAQKVNSWPGKPWPLPRRL